MSASASSKHGGLGRDLPTCQSRLLKDAKTVDNKMKELVLQMKNVVKNGFILPMPKSLSHQDGIVTQPARPGNPKLSINIKPNCVTNVVNPSPLKSQSIESSNNDRATSVPSLSATNPNSTPSGRTSLLTNQTPPLPGRLPSANRRVLLPELVEDLESLCKIRRQQRKFLSEAKQSAIADNFEGFANADDNYQASGNDDGFVAQVSRIIVNCIRVIYQFVLKFAQPPSDGGRPKSAIFSGRNAEILWGGSTAVKDGATSTIYGLLHSLEMLGDEDDNVDMVSFRIP